MFVFAWPFFLCIQLHAFVIYSLYNSDCFCIPCVIHSKGVLHIQCEPTWQGNGKKGRNRWSWYAFVWRRGLIYAVCCSHTCFMHVFMHAERLCIEVRNNKCFVAVWKVVTHNYYFRLETCTAFIVQTRCALLTGFVASGKPVFETANECSWWGTSRDKYTVHR